MSPALPMTVRKRVRGVCSEYPYTAQRVRRMLALSLGSFAWWAMNYPAPYVSANGRVRRWRDCPEVLYGIYGTNADSLRVVPLLSDEARKDARAVGGREAMEALLAYAVRTWTAPGRTAGLEVEQAAAEFTPPAAAARAARRAEKDQKHNQSPELFGSAGDTQPHGTNANG